jgi:hypothetical protein
MQTVEATEKSSVSGSGFDSDCEPDPDPELKGAGETLQSQVVQSSAAGGGADL